MHLNAGSPASGIIGKGLWGVALWEEVSVGTGFLKGKIIFLLFGAFSPEGGGQVGELRARLMPLLLRQITFK